MSPNIAEVHYSGLEIVDGRMAMRKVPVWPDHLTSDGWAPADQLRSRVTAMATPQRLLFEHDSRDLSRADLDTVYAYATSLIRKGERLCPERHL